MFQILWALLLVYLILLGLAFLFGREVGYEISFVVCMGIAGLVTASFAAVYILDRGIAAIAHRFSRSITHRGRRNSERGETG